jgi:hypothetical protein
MGINWHDKKQQMNFKLYPKVIDIIKKYSNLDDCTSTKVVEQALYEYDKHREELIEKSKKKLIEKGEPKSYFK